MTCSCNVSISSDLLPVGRFFHSPFPKHFPDISEFIQLIFDDILWSILVTCNSCPRRVACYKGSVGLHETYRDRVLWRNHFPFSQWSGLYLQFQLALRPSWKRCQLGSRVFTSDFPYVLDHQTYFPSYLACIRISREIIIQEFMDISIKYIKYTTSCYLFTW